MATCTNCFRDYSGSGACPHCGFDYSGHAEAYPLALRPGTVLGGRYVVGRVLGSGGFGITYIAQDFDTKQLVAIKEFLPEEMVTRVDDTTVRLHSVQHAQNFEFGLKNFLGEAQILSQFNGLANICNIYSYFEENNTAYFAMEYVNGVSLAKYISLRGGRLSLDETKKLLLPVMRALANVHAKGIMHRDVAPDNIMVKPDGSVMLIDFGAARYSLGEKSGSIDSVVKHGFAPIEQYSRRGKQGPFTDVYAMAATIYYAITGQVPVEAPSRIDGEELIPPRQLGAEISRSAEAVLLRALNTNGNERYQSMWDFAMALEREQDAKQKQEAPKVRQKAKKPQSRSRSKKPAARKEGWWKKPVIGIVSIVLILSIILFAGAESLSWHFYEKAWDNAVSDKDSAAVLNFRISAFFGNAYSMSSLGDAYHYGNGVKEDGQKALKWYLKALEEGNNSAYYSLGLLYSGDTEGIEPDYEKALANYLKAAELENEYAMEEIGHIYISGLGVEKDYKAGTEWYEKAIEYGYTDCMAELAAAYAAEDNPEPNYVRAAELWEILVNNGDSKLAYELGRLYESGIDIEQNYEKAAEIYQKGVNLGNTDCMVYLCLMYNEGRGVEKDIDKAVELLDKAAASGSSFAQSLKADYEQSGSIIKYNFTQGS